MRFPSLVQRGNHVEQGQTPCADRESSVFLIELVHSRPSEGLRRAWEGGVLLMSESLLVSLGWVPAISISKMLVCAYLSKIVRDIYVFPVLLFLVLCGACCKIVQTCLVRSSFWACQFWFEVPPEWVLSRVHPWVGVARNLLMVHPVWHWKFVPWDF